MVTNIGGKLSISRGISSPGKPYLAEEVTCFSFFIPWYGWIELHSHMLLQGPKCYILLESACLFVATCHDLRNRKV